MTRVTRTLKNVVGDDTYNVWLAMLHDLVPTGRIHRLAPMIAGMLQYAASRALDSKQRKIEGTEAWSLLAASEKADPDEAHEFLEDLLARLFKDARVKAKRTSARGMSYSIIEEAIQEFVRWEFMPWE
jgi:hypothetical protein